eukprot:scaffold10435_cov60-Phaeocystis_antarctica.AAC.1
MHVHVAAAAASMCGCSARLRERLLERQLSLLEHVHGHLVRGRGRVRRGVRVRVRVGVQELEFRFGLGHLLGARLARQLEHATQRVQVARVVLVREEPRRDGHVGLRVLVAHLTGAHHGVLVHLARARPLDLDLRVPRADLPRLPRLAPAAPALGGVPCARGRACSRARLLLLLRRRLGGVDVEGLDRRVEARKGEAFAEEAVALGRGQRGERLLALEPVCGRLPERGLPHAGAHRRALTDARRQLGPVAPLRGPGPEVGRDAIDLGAGREERCVAARLLEPLAAAYLTVGVHQDGDDQVCEDEGEEGREGGKHHKADGRVGLRVGAHACMQRVASMQRVAGST